VSAARMCATVQGVVQGVGFRSFVLREATALGLSGFVANRRDGGVDVVAEGDAARLQRLAAALKEGPRASRVERVDVSWEAATGEFDGFGVRFL